MGYTHCCAVVLSPVSSRSSMKAAKAAIKKMMASTHPLTSWNVEMEERLVFFIAASFFIVVWRPVHPAGIHTGTIIPYITGANNH